MALSREPFVDRAADPPVRGFLDLPSHATDRALVVTHGAGSNANAPFLVALAGAMADAGIAVLRCDLPFRQLRSFGPPRPGDAARDRAGLIQAVQAMKKRFSGATHLGGQSYGGRQGSMVASDNRDLVAGLLLFSYPLHPPSDPTRLRTEHLPRVKVPTLFVHGTRDPFGSIDEIEAARKLIPAKTQLMVVEGVGHDLGFARKMREVARTLPDTITKNFLDFFNFTRTES